MAHPLSIYLKRPRPVDKRKRGVSVETVWLVCVWQSGRWWPRQDLPPAFEERIADQVAREQARMSGRKHRAMPFALAPAES